MTPAVFQEAKRQQVSFLAPLEKRILLWIAARVPGRINSDHLTALGLASLLGAGLSYWFASLHSSSLLLATAFLGLNWLGDSLDGTLARIRNRQRPRYGFYVDHITDAFGTLFLLGGLALSGYMSPYIAAGLLIVYFMLSIETYLATYTIGVFHLSFWKLSPTELRVLLAVGNLALLYHPLARLGGVDYRLFDVGGAVGVTGMTAMLIASAARHTLELYREERLP
jgi:phosphatidylglycerophosphate synthase